MHCIRHQRHESEENDCCGENHGSPEHMKDEINGAVAVGNNSVWHMVQERHRNRVKSIMKKMIEARVNSCHFNCVLSLPHKTTNSEVVMNDDNVNGDEATTATVCSAVSLQMTHCYYRDDSQLNGWSSYTVLTIHPQDQINNRIELNGVVLSDRSPIMIPFIASSSSSSLSRQSSSGGETKNDTTAPPNAIQDERTLIEIGHAFMEDTLQRIDQELSKMSNQAAKVAYMSMNDQTNNNNNRSNTTMSVLDQLPSHHYQFNQVNNHGSYPPHMITTMASPSGNVVLHLNSGFYNLNSTMIDVTGDTNTKHPQCAINLNHNVMVPTIPQDDVREEEEEEPELELAHGVALLSSGVLCESTSHIVKSVAAPVGAPVNQKPSILNQLHNSRQSSSWLSQMMEESDSSSSLMPLLASTYQQHIMTNSQQQLLEQHIDQQQMEQEQLFDILFMQHQ